MNRPYPRSLVLAWLAIASFAALAGCRDEQRPLTTQNLTPAEAGFVTRFLQLERARAVALVDRARGEALLDSLAAAWGDSAVVESQASLPTDTERLARLHDLLARLLAAEEDSLLQAPVARRLHAPLPDPDPPESPEPGDGG